MIAGGTEAVITPLAVAGFCAMRALSTRNDEPEKASPAVGRRTATASSSARARGIVILEELEPAKRRGAPIYAELVGYGMSADAYHITAPHPEGDGAARVMRTALRDAGIDAGADRLHQRPRHLDAARRPRRDAGDQDRLRRPRLQAGGQLDQVVTGHLLGAAGGLETGILALAVRDQILPPTINLDEPGEGCDLDFVPHTARKVDLEYAAQQLLRLRRHQRVDHLEAVRGE